MKDLIKKNVYGVLNVLTLGKGIGRLINGVRIIFPVRYFRFFEADYEKENFETFKQHLKEGDVILDIGAHIGLQSVMMSKFAGRTGRVFSFEPTPDTFSILKETIRLNHLTDQISLVNKAVSYEKGQTSFNSSTAGVSNSIVNYDPTSKHSKITVDVISVDLFVKEAGLSKVDFIKIDAEGVEFDVLRGAGETIRKYHPKMILALHPNAIAANGNSLAQIYDILMNDHYRMTWENRYLTKEEFCAHHDLFDVYLSYSGENTNI